MYPFCGKPFSEFLKSKIPIGITFQFFYTCYKILTYFFGDRRQKILHLRYKALYFSKQNSYEKNTRVFFTVMSDYDGLPAYQQNKKMQR